MLMKHEKTLGPGQAYNKVDNGKQLPVNLFLTVQLFIHWKPLKGYFGEQ